MATLAKPQTPVDPAVYIDELAQMTFHLEMLFHLEARAWRLGDAGLPIAE